MLKIYFIIANTELLIHISKSVLVQFEKDFADNLGAEPSQPTTLSMEKYRTKKHMIHKSLEIGRMFHKF